jgi:transcriptional regulator of arginine metabolism
VSRLLRKLQAVKTSDGQGNIVYKLSHDGTMSVETGGVASLIVSIQSNGSLIVIQTTTGSAQLVAQYLDRARLPQILGTLAGDDTIFVAPSTSRVMPSTLEAIRQALAPTDA